MPFTDAHTNLHRTLVDPPPGWCVLYTETVTDSVDGPNQEDIAFGRRYGLDEDWRLGGILFRAKLLGPDGSTKYTSTMVESMVDLCKTEFWTEFWKQVEKK